MNCYGMGWDGTEKYVPWTNLKILLRNDNLKFRELKTQNNAYQAFFQKLSRLIVSLSSRQGKALMTVSFG